MPTSGQQTSAVKPAQHAVSRDAAHSRSGRPGQPLCGAAGDRRSGTSPRLAGSTRICAASAVARCGHPIRPQYEPVMTHTRLYTGDDERLTDCLEDYFNVRDDARDVRLAGLSRRAATTLFVSVVICT